MILGWENSREAVIIKTKMVLLNLIFLSENILAHLDVDTVVGTPKVPILKY